MALAALRDPGLVLESAAKAVGARDGLVDHVADKRLLVLLDNFEHLIAAAGDLPALLGSCPNLSLVVTSRELLQLAPEQSYPVPPLDPQDGVQLFVARAKAVDPAFEPDEAVPALCDRLDNLPLALELAAARVRVLSPQQLRERLAQRLDLLKAGRDADPRQQTLRATIEWSNDLLDEQEQRLFARLAVFRGGCTLEAAEQVADADLDTLQSLVDKSLVRHTNERFWMLETIREYAWEQLAERGEEPELRRRQALFVLDLAEVATQAIEKGGDQVELYARIAAELDNLRAALEWARDAGEDEVLLRLVAATGYSWKTRGLYQEADTWQPLALGRSKSPVQARMSVLRAASGRAMDIGEYARADELIAEWRSSPERAGNENQLLTALGSGALIAMERGDLDQARAQFIAIRDRALQVGDRDRVGAATVNLGLVALYSDDFEAGLAYAAEGAALFRELADDGGVATALINCGVSANALSDPARAKASFCEALTISARLGWRRGVIAAACGVAEALVAENQEERGVQLLGAAASLREEVGIEVDWQEQHDRALAAAKTALGEEAFAAAWARGEAMTPEEIIAFTMAS